MTSTNTSIISRSQIFPYRPKKRIQPRFYDLPQSQATTPPSSSECRCLRLNLRPPPPMQLAEAKLGHRHYRCRHRPPPLLRGVHPSCSNPSHQPHHRPQTLQRRHHTGSPPKPNPSSNSLLRTSFPRRGPLSSEPSLHVL